MVRECECECERGCGEAGENDQLSLLDHPEKD
jgi:hypothetical protein